MYKLNVENVLPMNDMFKTRRRQERGGCRKRKRLIKRKKELSKSSRR
jgi:hypothetical protein